MHLVDNTMQEAFNKQGYVLAQGFLPANICQELNDELAKMDVGNPQSFFVSADSPDAAFRLKTDALIRRLVSTELLDKYIVGYDLFFANSIRKTKGTNSECVIHTDWSIVDEADTMPLHIWIPLVEVSKQNGTLAVIPGSHKLTGKYRGLGVSSYYEEYYPNLQKDKAHYFELQPGTAVIYHPGLIHFSLENATDARRTAILLSFVPKGYQPVIYYRKPRGLFRRPKTGMYRLTKEYYSGWDKRSEPKLPIIKYVEEPVNNLPYPEFVKQLD